jgi:hypothetical protein
VALEMVRDHPLRGVGAGNFTLAELLPPYNAVSVEPAHVVPLLVTAEAGIVAGLAWLGLVLGPVLAEIWQHRRISLGRLALPAELLTLASFDHYFWTFASGQALFWLGLGVWLAGGGLTTSVAETENAAVTVRKPFGQRVRLRVARLRGLVPSPTTSPALRALSRGRPSPRRGTSWPQAPSADFNRRNHRHPTPEYQIPPEG